METTSGLSLSVSRDDNQLKHRLIDSLNHHIILMQTAFLKKCFSRTPLQGGPDRQREDFVFRHLCFSPGACIFFSFPLNIRSLISLKGKLHSMSFGTPTSLPVALHTVCWNSSTADALATIHENTAGAANCRQCQEQSLFLQHHFFNLLLSNGNI